MCRKVSSSEERVSQGYFHKGNEPAPIRMVVFVAPCRCRQKFWARLPGHTVRVEALIEGSLWQLSDN